MDTVKMRTCSHLLPDPGGEVVRDLLNEVERLTAIVDRYPKTADGVSVTPEMDVWSIGEAGPYCWSATCIDRNGCSGTFHGHYHGRVPMASVFSTRQAAEAAKGATDEHRPQPA